MKMKSNRKEKAQENEYQVFLVYPNTTNRVFRVLQGLNKFVNKTLHRVCSTADTWKFIVNIGITETRAWRGQQYLRAQDYPLKNIYDKWSEAV